MLTRRNLIVLVVVLAVLVAVSLIQRSQHEAATSRASSRELIAGEFARDDLARITIGHGPDTGAVVLSAGPDHWRVLSAYGARADTTKIDGLLETVSGLRGEFRSEDASVVADYGLTDSTSIRLRGYDGSGETVFDLEVGDRPQGSQGNFVRHPGESAVHLSTADVLGKLGLWSGPDEPTSRHFLHLRAFRARREAVERIDLATDEWSYGIVKEWAEDDTTGTEPTIDEKKWDWNFDDGDPAKKTMGDAVLNAVINIRAQDVVDPDADLATYGLDDPARRATVTMRDGETVELRFGDEREAEGDAPGGFYAMIGDDPTVWVVGTFNVNNIFKTRDELLP